MKTSKLALIAMRIFTGLVCTLIIVSATAEKIETLINAFGSLTFSSASEEEIRILGNEAHKFISDKQNAKVMSSMAGGELLRRQRKLANYLIIKKKLEECGAKSDRDLTARVLDAAGRAEILKIDCSNPFKELGALQQFVGNFRQHLDLQAKSDLQTNIFRQALKNSASTYLNLKLQYGTDAEIGLVDTTTVLELCRNREGKDLCDARTRVFLLDYARSYIDGFRKSKNRLTTFQAAAKINASVSQLNNTLEKVTLAGSESWLGGLIGGSAEITKESRDVFEKTYVSEYLAAASSGPGVLMLTETMKSKIGKLREINEDNRESKSYGSRKKTFTFSPHQRVDNADVYAAAKEAEGTLRKQANDLAEMEGTHQKQVAGDYPVWTNPHTVRNTDLSRLLRVNPQTVGQVLISNPEYASLICGTIDTIAQRDESDAKWKEAYIWGGAVVVGALLVTGVGSGAGAWLLAGTAKAATVATLSTIGTVSAAAGVTVGLVDGSYYLGRSINAANLQAQLEAAVMSGNSDKRGLQEARQALAEFNETKMHAILSLGMAPLDIAALVAVVKAGQYGAKLAGQTGVAKDALDGTTEVLKEVSKSPELGRLVQATRSTAGEDVFSFLGYLGQSSEKVREQILLKMKTWSPERFQKAIDDALGKIRSCGK